MELHDTIAAIASASGGAARGIIRISGPDAIGCLARCFSPAAGEILADAKHPHVVSGLLRLDEGAALPGDAWLWPTRRSYTREPVVEFHTLGSAPLLAAALRALCAAGARLAQPGEFTLRAFLAGRLDLTQAEAVLGVIDAANQAELEIALAQLSGGLAAPLRALRERLLDLLAQLEAGLDFVEEDIKFISPEALDEQLAAAADQAAGLAEQMTGRALAPGELRVVLIGWPNVGKSSLLNALAGQSAAIVSPSAGTTRDYVAVRSNLDGLDCLLVDTAGVMSVAGDGSVESAAQIKTAQQMKNAHLQLLCLDSTRPVNAWERQRLLEVESADRRLVVLTKCDAPRGTDYAGPACETSSQSGAGLADLSREIRRRITAISEQETQVVAGTADRCRESLRLAAESLARAREIAQATGGEELVAAEIRVALDELGKVVGAVYTDDVLDRIFSRFCIGK